MINQQKTLLSLVSISLLMFGCGGGETASGQLPSNSNPPAETPATTHDSNSNPIESIVDGKTVKYAYTYNTNNQIESKYYDYNNDRAIDQIDRYTYDSNGNVIMISIDYNIDTTKVDSVKNYLYNDKNQIITERVDENGDGIIDVSINYIYTNNVLTSKEYDYDNDGTLDEIKTVEEGR